MPHEIVLRLQRVEGLDGVLVTGSDGVGGARSNSGAQAILTHGPHITHHGELVRLGAARPARRGEAVGLIAALRGIIVLGIRGQAIERNVVVPGGRGRVGDGRLRRGSALETPAAAAKVHGRALQLLVRIPRDGHAMGTGVGQADLLGHGVLVAGAAAIVGIGGGREGQDGSLAQHRQHFQSVYQSDCLVRTVRTEGVAEGGGDGAIQKRREIVQAGDNLY